MDTHGNHVPHNKTPEEDIRTARHHIESFVVVESHYSQKDSKRLF